MFIASRAKERVSDSVSREEVHARTGVCAVCECAHPTSKLQGTVQGPTYGRNCGGRRGAVECGWQGLPAMGTGLPYGFTYGLAGERVHARVSAYGELRAS